MFRKLFLVVVALCFTATVAFAGNFKLTSPTLKSGATLAADQLFDGFGCTGKNQSPALKWTPGPKGTKSYAITVYDPDAPTGSGWWHWVVYNIPGNVTELAYGAGDATGKLLPSEALQGRTDYGTHAFGGACPPKGDKPHRYIFTVYALKIEKIDAPAEASAALLGFMIHANTLAKSSFTAKYGR